MRKKRKRQRSCVNDHVLGGSMNATNSCGYCSVVYGTVCRHVMCEQVFRRLCVLYCTVLSRQYCTLLYYWTYSSVQCSTLSVWYGTDRQGPSCVKRPKLHIKSHTRAP